VSFFFVSGNNSFSFFSYGGNNSVSVLFSIRVMNVEFITEINESRPKKSTSVSPNETMTFGANSVSNINQPLPSPKISDDNHIIISQLFDRRLGLLSPYSHIWVELLKLFQ
jgi:hypothetical protein